MVKAQYFGKYEVESDQDYAEYCEGKIIGMILTV
jgi:hypothetical protein